MPTAGYVRLFNQRLDQLSEDDLGLMRQRCGVLFQSGALFSAFNVFDNIAFPLRESRLVDRRLIRDLVYMKLELAGLNAEVATLLPAALSGGMVKRVALARALALEPELLFLDEPTSGLDPVTAQTFVDHIAALHRELGFTAIVITHDLDLMHDLCTRLAILADRHIVALGAPSAVFPSRNPFVDTLFSGVRGQRVFGPGTLHE